MARLKKEVREAESVRRRARENEIRTGRQDPAVQQLVQQLAKQRRGLSGRVEAAFAAQQMRTQTASQLADFARELRTETDRMIRERDDEQRRPG